MDRFPHDVTPRRQSFPAEHTFSARLKLSRTPRTPGFRHGYDEQTLSGMITPPMEKASLSRTRTRILLEMGVRGPPISLPSMVYWFVSTSVVAILTVNEHGGGYRTPKPGRGYQGAGDRGTSILRLPNDIEGHHTQHVCHELTICNTSSPQKYSIAEHNTQEEPRHLS